MPRRNSRKTKKSIKRPKSIKRRSRKTSARRSKATAYQTGVKTHWGESDNNWMIPQAGNLPSRNGEQHTGTNWLGTEVDWT